MPTSSTNATTAASRDSMARSWGLIKFSKNGDEVVGLKGTNFAAFLADRFNLCVIDDEPHFLKFDKGEQCCDNVYVSGREWLGKIAKRYAPNLSKRTYDDLVQDIEDELADAEERGLIFQSSRNVFCDAEGKIIRINTMPAAGQDIVEVVGSLSADDHITDARRINCVYDPTITEHEFVDHWLLETAQGDPWLAWLMVQASMSSCLCPSSEYKGLVVLYGPGSDSKGVMSHVRYSMFSPSAFFKGKLHKLAGFQPAMMLGKIGFVDDDLQNGSLSEDVSTLLKGWTGSDIIDVEPKYGTKTVPVSDPTFIVLTNHPMQFAQLEHATDAWDRRLTVVPFYQQYKENPDASKGELPIIKEYHRLITEDPSAMSYLLNLALTGVDMMITNGGYVKTKESERLKREWLGLGNSVADFLDEVDVFGGEWDCPHVVRIGTSARETALVYPVHMAESAPVYENLRQQKKQRYCTEYYDEIREHREMTIYGSDLKVDYVYLANDIACMLGRYAAWHSANGGDGRGRLQRNSFSRLLKPMGYGTTQKRVELYGGKKATLVHPATVDVNEWLNRQRLEHEKPDKHQIAYRTLRDDVRYAIKRDGMLRERGRGGSSKVQLPVRLLDGTDYIRAEDVDELSEQARRKLSLIGLMFVSNLYCEKYGHTLTPNVSTEKVPAG